MGHLCHRVRESQSNMIGYAHALSARVLHIDLSMSIPYTILVSLYSLPSGVGPLLTMTDEEVNYRDCGCRIT
jgi:hypothetical protein